MEYTNLKEIYYEKDNIFNGTGGPHGGTHHILF